MINWKLSVTKSKLIKLIRKLLNRGNLVNIKKSIYKDKLGYYKYSKRFIKTNIIIFVIIPFWITLIIFKGCNLGN